MKKLKSVYCVALYCALPMMLQVLATTTKSPNIQRLIRSAVKSKLNRLSQAGSSKQITFVHLVQSDWGMFPAGTHITLVDGKVLTLPDVNLNGTIRNVIRVTLPTGKAFNLADVRERNNFRTWMRSLKPASAKPALALPTARPSCGCGRRNQSAKNTKRVNVSLKKNT